jgi:hypothetical protein
MINSQKENYLHFFESKDGKLSMRNRLTLRVFQEKYLGSIKLEVLDEEINLLSSAQEMAY